MVVLVLLTPPLTTHGLRLTPPKKAASRVCPRGAPMLLSLVAPAYGPRHDAHTLSTNGTDKGGLVSVSKKAASSLFVVDLWSGEPHHMCEGCICSYQHVSNFRCQEWLSCKCERCRCEQNVIQKALGYACSKDTTFFNSCTGCLDMPPPPPPPPPSDTMVRKDFAAWQAMVAARAAEREAKAKNKTRAAVQQQAQAEPSWDHLKRSWDCVGDRAETLKYENMIHGPGGGRVL